MSDRDVRASLTDMSTLRQLQISREHVTVGELVQDLVEAAISYTDDAFKEGDRAEHLASAASLEACAIRLVCAGAGRPFTDEQAEAFILFGRETPPLTEKEKKRVEGIFRALDMIR